MPIAGEHAARTAEEVADDRALASGIAGDARRRASARRSMRSPRATGPKPPRILIAGSLYLAGAVLEGNGNLPR